MSAREKIAYIKGLIDANGSEGSSSVSMYGAILSALEALVEENEELNAKLDDLQEDYDELLDFCEELDEDLAELETNMWSDDYEEDFDAMDYDDDPSDEDDSYESVICPSCGLVFYYHPSLSLTTDVILCPDCNVQIILETEISADEKEDDDIGG